VVKSKKPKIEGGSMVAKPYPILCRAVEVGVTYGWQRAHKYTDTPDATAIKDAIEQAVLNEVCESFDFPEYN